MPDYRFLMWSDADNLSLVRAIIPKYEKQFVDLKRGVIRADIARCLYLYAHGGIYIDTDYKFFRPIGEEFLRNKLVLGIEETFNSWIKTSKYGNAFMASEPDLPFWLNFVAGAFDRARNGEKLLMIAGPHALSLALSKDKETFDALTILQSDVLYPDSRTLAMIRPPSVETLGVHLCWGSWRNKGWWRSVLTRARRILSAIL